MGMRDEVANDQSDSRDAIMSATFRALSRHGYADLTMQDIADEFEKSRSLLHYHYDTRDDLILAFVDNLIGWVGDELEESSTEDPRTRLLEYIERFSPNQREYARGFVVALFELRLQALHNEQLREKLARHYQQNIDTAARIIADGIEAGVFHPVNPEKTGELIYNSLQGAAFYEVVLGADGATQRMRDGLLEYIVSELVAVPEMLETGFAP
ncbi:TetR/AcrR family transcriptional regulator [Haloarcula amylolytica]|uniref:TetR family transcriptional regulator n=1 Tax=Haloarcula amylolytica JCM 13557 TaxID=1227452 RepID=M0JXW6_9EURY|nr:TetR/AcrR family transcriptional regulator [Haloarcula amylolytica]EMA13972.1 TetR family transcriptional regulator [Haloarcula amylolytica JCM 13557]